MKYDQAYLESRGWKLVKTRSIDGGVVKLYDHPDHQHALRGFFNQSDAISHQKSLDRGSACLCAAHDGGRR